jgi:hypothetical protein
MSKQDVDQKPVSEDTKQEPVSEDVEQASVVGDADKTDQDKAKEQTCHNEPPDSDEKQRQEGLAELNALIKRAQAGDRSAIPRLREYLRINPQMWRGTGDLAIQSQRAWIDVIAGPDLHLRDCILRRVGELKRELSTESGTALESLLVERIISTYLQVYHAETKEAEFDETSLRWATFQLKRLDSAHRRHVSSIGALATLRNLMSRPAIQPAQKTIEDVNAGKPEATTNGHDHGSLPAKVNGTNGSASSPARTNGHNRLAAVLQTTGSQPKE